MCVVVWMSHFYFTVFDFCFFVLQGLWELWYRIWHLCFVIYSRKRGWRGWLLAGWTTMLVCLSCLYWSLHLLQLLLRALKCGLLAGKQLSLRLDRISYGNLNNLQLCYMPCGSIMHTFVVVHKNSGWTDYRMLCALSLMFSMKQKVNGHLYWPNISVISLLCT